MEGSKKEGELLLVFGTSSGKKETRVFTEQPLGLQFRSKMPITIKRVREGSQAEQLEVQLGWELLSIGDVSLEGMTIAQASRELRDSLAPLRQCMHVRRAPLDAMSVADLSAKLRGIRGVDVVPFLKKFGFNARSSSSWEQGAEHPELRMGMIDGHRRHGKCKHTWYVIVGKIVASDASFTQLWQVERRLAHIRALLHDPVKRELGNAYKLYFQTAHFAHHGGPPGTTAKVGSWLAALSKAINVKILSPALVAAIMRFLETPLLSKVAGEALPTREHLRTAGLSAEGINQQEDMKDAGFEESETQESPDNKSGQETDEEERGLEQALSFLEEDEEVEMPAEAPMMEM